MQCSAIPALQDIYCKDILAHIAASFAMAPNGTGDNVVVLVIQRKDAGGRTGRALVCAGRYEYCTHNGVTDLIYYRRVERGYIVITGYCDRQGQFHMLQIGVLSESEMDRLRGHPRTARRARSRASGDCPFCL
jgi:hypothetical protein